MRLKSGIQQGNTACVPVAPKIGVDEFFYAVFRRFDA
jgi:hypothetical protein